jgi:hypothetical protein
MKATKYSLKKWELGNGRLREYNRRYELVQGTLHCMNLWKYQNKASLFY